MVILRTQSEFGHAPPPQSQYSIITNVPGWDLLKGLREGDTSFLARVVHNYPRFSPMHSVRTLAAAVAKVVGHEDKGCMMYLDPVMWKYTASFAAHQSRKEHAIDANKLTYKVADVSGHRLYAVIYELEHAKAVFSSWGIPGRGISIRAAEQLLENIDSAVEVPFQSVEFPPEPTWTPEGPAHEALRQRILTLLERGAINPEEAKSQSQDVFLYPSGMAAVFTAKELLQDYRPGGINIELGITFHHTHELFHDESPGGLKHIPTVDTEALDGLEDWLEKHKSEGGATFVFVEFPENPTLETVNLPRLKKLSEEHGFVLIVDDTVSSFSNVDVLAQSDILLTSLTKSFSGRADVLGGSIVLNPMSPHYTELSKRFTAAHSNQLFTADANVLLSNSDDYLERSIRLNANGQTIAEFLHNSIIQPDSPVTNVQYPSLLASKPKYDICMRRSTLELPRPGYGCLLTVEFDGEDTAKAFFDRCGFYPSPHLGGHVTIMLPYNMLMFGRDKEEAARLRSCGIKEESIRISAGLESEQDLLDTLQDALQAAVEAKKARKAHSSS